MKQFISIILLAVLPLLASAHDAEIDGIKTIDNGQLTIDNEDACYSLDGKKLDKPQKGINIIRQPDGTSRKVLVK